MAANFSACPSCGVRLSHQSMQFHQQLCGKQKSSNPGGPRGAVPNFMSSPSASVPVRRSGGGLSAQELDALRHEVYGGGGSKSPGVPVRGNVRNTVHDERLETTPEARNEQPPRASGGGSRATSPSATVNARRHIEVREEIQPPLAGEYAQPPAEGRVPYREQPPAEGRLPHREQRAQPFDGPPSDVAELRLLTQRMGDELRHLRDDVAFLQRENAALRREIEQQSPKDADHDHMLALQQEVRELRRKVDGLTMHLDDHESHCDARIRALQHDSSSTTLSRRGDPYSDRAEKQPRSSAERSVPREEYVYGKSTAAKKNVAGSRPATNPSRPSAVVTRNDYRYDDEDKGSGLLNTQRGVPTPAGVTPQRVAYTTPRFQRNVEPSDEPSDYADVTRPQGSYGRGYDDPHQQLPVDASMRKETENLVSKALQKRAPASAVYSTRSSSRASDSSGLDGYFNNAGGGDLVYSRQGSRN